MKYNNQSEKLLSDGIRIHVFSSETTLTLEKRYRADDFVIRTATQGDTPSSFALG